MSDAQVSVCFVCLGNICRSPTAEGIFIQLVEQAGLSGRIRIDSAGTGAFHVGEGADARSQACANRHGVKLPSISRQFVAADFDRFDYLVAMDSRNHRDMERLGHGAQLDKLHMLRSFDPNVRGSFDVPDPYYGNGDDGFERVFSICRAGCEGLLAHIQARHFGSR